MSSVVEHLLISEHLLKPHLCVYIYGLHFDGYYNIYLWVDIVALAFRYRSKGYHHFSS